MTARTIITALTLSLALVMATGLGLSWIDMDQNNDSDGDGVLNFQEITMDCTLPGDNQSVPVDDATWSALQALFR